MHEFLSGFILPLPLLWLLIVAGIIAFFLKRQRIAGLFWVGALFWLGLISTEPLPRLLVSLLERTYPPLLSIEKPDSSSSVYIMVLGSGHTDDKSLPPNSQLDHTVMGRMIEGIRLYHNIPGSKLVFSGDIRDQTESQAVILSQTAGFLGVSDEDINLFTTTKNTSDEAATFRLTFGTQHRVYVVTDAVHMPRVMYLFTKEGLRVTAAPTNYHNKKGSVSHPLRMLVPNSENIATMEAVVHELVGLVWARI